MSKTKTIQKNQSNETAKIETNLASLNTRYSEAAHALAGSSTQNTINALTFCRVIFDADAFFSVKNKSYPKKVAKLYRDGLKQFRADHKLSASKFSQYKSIGDRYDLFSSQVSNLPPGWTLLYELSKLEDTQFLAVVQDGRISAWSTQRDVRHAVRSFNPKKQRAVTVAAPAPATVPYVSLNVPLYYTVFNAKKFLAFEVALRAFVRSYGETNWDGVSYQIEQSTDLVTLLTKSEADIAA